MSGTIDYYFTLVSPFVWLGHRAFVEIAKRHGKEIRYRPINIGGVWQVSGSVPLGQRSPLRQRYRLIELQRMAEWRGLDLKLQPESFPCNPELADRCVIAISASGGNPDDFIHAVGEALWSHDRSIADATVLEELLEACGHDSKKMLELAQTDESARARQENTDAAAAADATGAPTYVYLGEPFWGQDRLDLLDRMLTTGRKPFTA